LKVRERAIVFGASGTLGSEIANDLTESGLDVIRVTRAPKSDRNWVSTSNPHWCQDVDVNPFSRIIFAQGVNSHGGIVQVTGEAIREAMEANVISIVDAIKTLNESRLIADPARICIIGSVWANIARQDKLAYTVSKSAVSGLVRSLCADLSSQGIIVNAILPGVVDSPMTREFLDETSIAKLEAETPTRSLISARDVARIANWLTSPGSQGITGQSIVVDNGWSATRYV